jgi:hypothetical protein
MLLVLNFYINLDLEFLKFTLFLMVEYYARVHVPNRNQTSNF